jgi:hypothetical protein
MTGQPYTQDVADVRRIDEPLPPVEHIAPDVDPPDPMESMHPVERLLTEIAVNTRKDPQFYLPTDLTQRQFQLPASAGTLTVEVAVERPYILITGDNGVPRNLIISRGLSAGYPISPCPKGAAFLMEYPYTDSLTITYDNAGAANDNLYLTMSSQRIYVSLVK